MTTFFNKPAYMLKIILDSIKEKPAFGLFCILFLVCIIIECVSICVADRSTLGFGGTLILLIVFMSTIIKRNDIIQIFKELER